MSEFEYKNINQTDRMHFEQTIAKIAKDSHNKGFNKGLAKGSSLASDLLIEAGHIATGESVAGFLAVCSCGGAYDSVEDHFISVARSNVKHDVYDVLRNIHETFPEMRLMQILVNSLPEGDNYYITDEAVIEMLENTYKELSNNEE
jgi:hypothetical protein